ncbi:Uncharacterised protein [Klebsiella pneumoniae]|nr:Uncharacterised protein [Klebsiella pneumoniae]
MRVHHELGICLGHVQYVVNMQNEFFGYAQLHVQ